MIRDFIRMCEAVTQDEWNIPTISRHGWKGADQCEDTLLPHSLHLISTMTVLICCLGVISLGSTCSKDTHIDMWLNLHHHSQGTRPSLG